MKVFEYCVYLGYLFDNKYKRGLVFVKDNESAYDVVMKKYTDEARDDKDLVELRYIKETNIVEFYI